ncbi:MAG: mannose-6-phosphate isomerase [Ilumatobacteraceae bacterium]|jgi:mannose-6-phosphate isomerase
MLHRPLRLPDNRVPVYYEGGAGIDRFRGELGGGQSGPEDWVASLCRLPTSIVGADAPPDAGLSKTLDGTTLIDLVQGDPAGWLGGALAGRYGGDSGLLVKLLDAGERLPVHCHPTRSFGADHLGSLFGKTEGWIIMDAAAGARVWLGMCDDIDVATLRRWIEHQDATSMLAAMNEIEVTAGQVVFVPAGLPHSIGPGVMLTELQEPTSFSVLAEYEVFGLDDQQATLGLGWDVALECFDLGGYKGDRLAELLPQRTEWSMQPGGTIFDLFPLAADEFFSARLVRCTGTVELTEPSFAVLVITDGFGTLRWEGGHEPVKRGETWVVPYSAGTTNFAGDVEAIVCMPPNADDSDRSDRTRR